MWTAVEGSLSPAGPRREGTGNSYKLDLGVIFSDATGTIRTLRMYSANKITGLVSDVPGEIMPEPNLWGMTTMAPQAP